MLLLFFFPLEADRDGFDPCVLREGLLVLRHRFLQLADLLLKAFLGVEEANSSGTFRSPSIVSRKRNLEAVAGRTLIRLGITSVKTIVPTSSPIQRVCNWLFVITTGMSVRMSQVDSISPEVLALCCGGVL